MIQPLAFVFGSVIAGALVGSTVRKGAWYEKLQKPSWSPPKQVFGPVWTILYAAMGYSLYLAWKAGAPRATLALFALQFALNLVWSPLFFTLQSPKLALVDIILLLTAIIATCVQFYKVSPAASALLVPYAAWVAFAMLLNASIVQLN